MSSRNIELAEQSLAAAKETYRTNDIGPWARHVAEYYHPEVVLETGGVGTFTEGNWRGHEGAVGFVANQMEVLEDMWIELHDVSEVRKGEEGCLVASISFGGRARHSGIDVRLDPTHVFELREGMVVRWRIFQTRAEALAAVAADERV